MSIRVANYVLAALFWLVCTLAAGSAQAKDSNELGKPEEVSLTLYADGQALVREHRQTSLSRGHNRLVVRTLPAGIDTTSIRVEAKGVSLVEVREGSSNVPSSSGGRDDYEADPRATIRVPNGEVVGEWVLDAELPYSGQVVVSYLVPGIQYEASLDIVSKAKGATELDGWITIRNQTGVRYVDAAVVLVTAPARRTNNQSQPGSVARRREVALDDRVTLDPGQTKRIRVLSRRPELDPERLIIEGGRLREYDQALPPNQKLNRGDLGTTPVHAEWRRRLRDEDVQAIIRSLPPLTRRVYSKRLKGSELLYEDKLDPVSMSPEVSLQRADDIRVERRQLQFTRNKDPQSSEETIELVVANDGSRAAKITIVENLFRSPNFEIPRSSRDLEIGIDQGRQVGTARISVDPGKKSKLTYTVTYRP